MATLQFKGKSAVWNHHLSVPYHTLEADKKLSLPGSNAIENLIIEGDNLLALKALLPKYQGQIKCIYIDPPYNTGNESWAYSDAVNSPVVKEWMGQVVAKDDLTKHDKWLCMMVPRLKLLRELLSLDGVIFISIDDNELTNLKSIMDEVFDESNFISTIIVQLNPRGRTLDKFLAKTHEYILLYAKDASIGQPINSIQKTGKLLDTYNHEDDEKGIFRLLELRNRNPVFNRKNRPNLYFPLYLNQSDNSVAIARDATHTTEVFPLNMKNEEGCWTWGKNKVLQNIDQLVGKKVSTGAFRIYRKDYLHDDEGNEATTKEKALWLDTNINNENGKEMVNSLFSKPVFDFPKSIELVKKCLVLGTQKDSIVLDSFAGSGTTAHAVLAQNKEDGGNRKFILVEMEDYTNSITAERVRRAVKRDEYKTGFTYYKLGPAIDADTMLAGELPTYENFAKYVYYLATGNDHPGVKTIDQKSYFVGKTERESIYLVYERDMEKLKSLAITLKWAQDTQAKDKGKKIVYAPACYLDEESLDQYNIQFVSIPYNLFERNDL